MRTIYIAVVSWVAVACLPSCSSGAAGGGGGGWAGGGGGSFGSGVIGQACDSTKPCGAGLYCYEGDTAELRGLCTTNCTASSGTDSCLLKYPNTSCLVAGVCGASCGNGLACPPGSSCDTDYEVCVNLGSPGNTCSYAFDGVCDVPGPCMPGTDDADCSPANQNSCQYAYNGICDEGYGCAPGTDTADCQT